MKGSSLFPFTQNFRWSHLIGVICDAEDVAEVSVRAGKVILKKANDIPQMLDMVQFLKKNIPNAVELLNNVSDFQEAIDIITEKLNKTDDINLTKDKAKELEELLEETENEDEVIRTSTHLDIKYTKDVSKEIGTDVWSLKPFERGDIIDEAINKHSVPGSWGLGKTFPVVDRLERENRIVVSTKSINLGLASYQYSSRLFYTLNKNAEALICFNDDYFYLEDGKMDVRYGNKLRLQDFDYKAIEIVVPDIIINQRTLNILNDFRGALKLEGIDVWFVIVL